MAIQTTIIISVVLVVFLLWETKRPAREYSESEKKNSYLTNTFVFLLNNVVFYLAGIGAVYATISTLDRGTFFGDVPLWLQWILGILLLDLAIWFWHFMNHKIPLLWQFHQTHHSEKYLNATSALRFHLGELLLSAGYKIGILYITNIPLGIFVAYEAIITICAIYHHANIRMPEKLRNILERIIITPRLHRIHHSDKRTQHDSNYGVLFSWWDILFKTRQKSRLEKIGLLYGGDKNLMSFLLMPFTKQRVDK